MDSIPKIFEEMINEVAPEVPEEWNNSIFFELPNLPIESREEVGEEFLACLLREIGYEVDWKQQLDRECDIILDSTRKLEVNTAILGINKMFHHEEIEKYGDFDFLVLLDIAYDDSVYLTVAPKELLPFDEENQMWTSAKKKLFMGRKGAYKWDLSQSDVNSRKIRTIHDVEKIFKEAFEMQDKPN